MRYDPEFLAGCSSLVNLGVVAAIAKGLTQNMETRLNWLSKVMDFIDPKVSHYISI